YLDGTAGGGGHSRAILEASAPDGCVYALDRDEEAIREASAALSAFGDRVTIRQGNFSRAGEIFPNLVFNGALIDIGVSSYQLDTPLRGFSCDRDGPLDMRMDRSGRMDAAQVLAEADEYKLAKVFRDFGETPFSRRLAREIVSRRDQEPIRTTGRLAGIVRSAVPRRYERKTLVLVFQALRIFVNHELELLSRGLETLFKMLEPGGRLAVISYHSLEDRLVKRFFAGLANPPCTCPPGLPVCSCGRVPQASLPVRKLVRPTESEVAANTRSRSARLRVVEKLDLA
ncbi:MAG: 16S rRNA (cytosine(1402)-N(4))-methyltransferase RsmH, partial [Gemmatimonadota bacterium]|nr:16S rRNA (cytosine(1402)-N(4))-methyltransferase RsmH [Gemmatimonadota bacterium]